LVKSSGSPSSRQNRNTGIAGVPPGTSNTLAYVSNLLAGSSSFVIIVGTSSGITEWTVGDSQNNQYTLIAYNSGQGTGAPAPRSVYVFAAPNTSAAACTVTITNSGSATPSGAIFITEITSLSPPVFTPVFRPIVTQDLPGFSTGKLDLLHGGTGANLTATGGASQVLQQTSVGGTITVGQLAFSNLSGTATYAQLPLVQSIVSFSATPTFTATNAGSFVIVLTGNVTSSTLAGGTAGQQVVFIIKQDGAGAHTFVWPTNMKGTGTIAGTASGYNVQPFTFDGTNWLASSAMQSFT